MSMNCPGVWCLSVLTFGLFTAVSGYLGYPRGASCGCFGVIQATPWHAFAVDSMALAAVKPDFNWSRDGFPRAALGAS